MPLASLSHAAQAEASAGVERSDIEVRRRGERLAVGGGRVPGWDRVRVLVGWMSSGEK